MSATKTEAQQKLLRRALMAIGGVCIIAAAYYAYAALHAHAAGSRAVKLAETLQSTMADERKKSGANMSAVNGASAGRGGPNPAGAIATADGKGTDSDSARGARGERGARGTGNTRGTSGTQTLLAAAGRRGDARTSSTKSAINTALTSAATLRTTTTLARGRNSGVRGASPEGGIAAVASQLPPGVSMPPGVMMASGSPAGGAARGRRGGPGSAVNDAITGLLKAHPVFGTPPEQSYAVQGVLGGSALINGQWLALGATQGNMKLIEIRPDKVAIEVDGQRRELSMWQDLPQGGGGGSNGAFGSPAGLSGGGPSTPGGAMPSRGGSASPPVGRRGAPGTPMPMPPGGLPPGVTMIMGPNGPMIMN